MSLKPEMSISAGLATAALVYAIYSNATPSITEIRAAKPGNTDVAASRKMATVAAFGSVAAISLIAKDSTIFIVGGAMAIAMDYWTRHANAVDPRTGKAATVMGANAGTGTLPVETQDTAPEAYGYDQTDMAGSY